LARLAPADQDWPGCVIEDHPDFAVRGVMLDISRDRVPITAALHALVDALADLKINQLQLYTEHTFAYPGHEQVWRNASPMTPAQMQTLDELCHARHVELVPNQQSFGHWHRWLVHSDYQGLAEHAQGIEHAFAVGPEPFGLDASHPRTLLLLGELYDALLPCFRSRQLNVGLDETLDLGLGRSRARCEAEGKGRVYLEFLRRVHGLVTERGHRMQFWGDVILEYPELVGELPADAIALEWGYEAGHPFEDHAARFAASGLEFHVCPGTSSWQGPIGRTTNAERNLREAAAAGKHHGAAGYLITDWGDFGHWQPPDVARPGLVLGAQHAWNVDGVLGRGAWARAIDDHLPAAVSGATLLALGDAYLAVGSACKNASPWFYVLRYLHQSFPPAIAPDLPTADFGAGLDALDSFDLSGPLGSAVSLSRLGCRLALASAGAGATVADLRAPDRSALATELRRMLPAYREGWLTTSRPGGLDESVSKLTAIADLLEQLEGARP
ncbi:MAG: family 20 glycosylhydrolase, partial [Planctomycetota bacterium]|nr:family 20 glycosylhydrolase [Planctomycetota bacterium]